jgi:dolichyl-phosphate-mannose-protein mannosyltransferase
MEATLDGTLPPAPAEGPVRLSWHDRLVDPMPSDRLAGWLGPLGLTVVAGLMRFWGLTSRKGIYFDEVYYTHDAYTLFHHGYEQDTTCTGPGFVVHPPLGKWLMGLSEWLFGHTDCAGGRHGDPELGWRFASAVCGTLAVLVLARVARRMFRSTLLGCFAGLVMAFDGLEFVQSRIGILDIFLMTGLVLALACLVADRDDGRRRLAARLDAAVAAGTGSAVATVGRGPRLGVRPWRVLCGVCLGLSLGVKWSAIYTVVGFAALALAWDVGARRSAGVERPLRSFLRKDSAGWFGCFVPLPFVLFLGTWIGWFVTRGGYDRERYGDGHGLVNILRSWADYQKQIYVFHDHLSTPHPYESKPFSWLVLGRPVDYDFTSLKYGQDGCHLRGGCYKEILAIGNPAVWWIGTLALVGTLALWVVRRDWRAALIMVSFVTSFVPWLAFPQRTMFFFYALPLLPFMVLGITAMAGLILGGRAITELRALVGALIVGVYAIIVVLLFVYFYPILANQMISIPAWRARMWFPGWI